MQAVVVAFAVLEEERRGLGLPGGMAAVEKFGVLGRIAHVDLHRLVPAVGDLGKRRIERGAQRCHDVGQRIGEVLVLAAPEAVPAHDDAAAEDAVGSVARGERGAVVGRKLAADDRAAVRVEFLAELSAS